MLQNYKTKRDEGFTIIEVLIVLAIAGLILLIVFLAVPALNRQAHNTSIKNDVSGTLAAVSEYVNNNNGTVPVAGASGVANNVAYIGGTPANCTSTATLNCATAKLGYESTVTVVGIASNPSAPALGIVDIVTSATCSGNAPTGTGATARDYAAYYQLEGGAVQCSD